MYTFTVGRERREYVTRINVSCTTDHTPDKLH